MHAQHSPSLQHVLRLSVCPRKGAAAVQELALPPLSTGASQGMKEREAKLGCGGWEVKKKNRVKWPQAASHIVVKIFVIKWFWRGGCIAGLPRAEGASKCPVFWH